jgi:hypothetical protein
MMSTQTETDASCLLNLVGGFWTTQVICTAVELGLADALAQGPCSIQSLATRLNANCDAIDRLLQSLVSLGVCRADAMSNYALTSMGDLLVDDHPRSLRGWTILTGRYFWKRWENLSDVVRSGSAVHTLRGEGDRFQSLNERPTEAVDFNRAMTELTRLVATDVARIVAQIAAPNATVIDVGGGHGELLSVILNENQGLQGKIFDLAHAAPGAQQLLNQRHLHDRANFIAGSFFTTVPDGDILLMKSILHDWDTEHCDTLLQVCAAHLGQSGQLLIVERILPDQVSVLPGHQAICRSDLNMLVGTGGRERTYAEYEAMLQRAKLRIADSRAICAGFTVLLCKHCCC